MTPQQVFVVVDGDYSDYHIVSVWLTEEEARAHGGRIEVWPIGEGKRTRGRFHRGADIDITTMMVNEHSSDSPDLGPESTTVVYWPSSNGWSANKVGIRVCCDTPERADKVYGETLARVKAELSSGLPLEAICDQKYVNGNWIPTDRITAR